MVSTLAALLALVSIVSAFVVFMVSFLAKWLVGDLRSRIGRARQDELEWQHVLEGFRTGLPGGEHEELDLFGLDEVVRLLNADFRIHISEFRTRVQDDQLQATAQPFFTSRFYFVGRTRVRQRATFSACRGAL
jgi:hypothetical protein